MFFEKKSFDNTFIRKKVNTHIRMLETNLAIFQNIHTQ